MAKKSTTKKTKKAVSRKPSKQTTEIVVRVESQPNVPSVAELAQPMKDGKALSLEKTWVSEKQILRMVQRTPKEHIYTRPAKGGGVWDYVTGTYIEKVLNFTFGFLWDFEVVSHAREGDQVYVLGKLTVKSPKGDTITKSQFGRADIKFKKNSKEMLDFGNDLKGAATDSLKKCASLLGIASDIYGKAEFKEEAKKDIPNEHVYSRDTHLGNIPVPQKAQTALKKDQVFGPDNEPTYVCSETGDPISDAEYEYSKKVFGRALSREAQKDAKPRK